MTAIPGLIVCLQSGFYTVQSPDGLRVCNLRGRLKQGQRSGDVAALGDRVLVSQLAPGRGMIEEILERRSALSRTAPTPRGEYQQIIIANPDQAVFIFACARPAAHFGMLDRFLVIAAKQGIAAVIIANKVDLVGLETARMFFDHYTRLGYPVVYTSVKSEEGIDELRAHLASKISVLAGPSGVGKSSLLNMLLPELQLKEQEVSQTTTKGKHTTVRRELYPLPGGGYVADTPGLKALALWDIQAEELDGYFPEMHGLVEYCQFNDCTHVHEPRCAVKAAVQDGQIHPERYQSYLRMRFGDSEAAEW